MAPNEGKRGGFRAIRRVNTTTATQDARVESGQPEPSAKRQRVGATIDPEGQQEEYRMRSPEPRTYIHPPSSSSASGSTQETSETTPLPSTDEPTKKKTRNAQVLEDFSGCMPTLRDALLVEEANPLFGKPCSCANDSSQPTRTVDCHCCQQYEASCESCFLEQHRTSPLHWAHVWTPNAGFTVKKDISQLSPDGKGGYVIQLGHNGRSCPNATSLSDSPAILFTIVHTNGIHETKLRFCKCHRAGDRLEQLLRARLFPATAQLPVTAFSFQLLEEFHTHHLESKKAVYDYLGAICRLTDNVFTADVPDVYASLHRVAQLWGLLTAEKRMGQMHGIDTLLPYRPKGNLRVYCPACPEPALASLPGSNQIPEELRHLNQQTYTLDGNHHLNQYEKSARTDPDDVALWAGRAYMPSDPEYRAQMEAIRASGRDEKAEGDCDYLKAAQKQKLHKFKGLEVTGVVNAQCEHVFIQASVDLQGGERLQNSDAALAGALLMQLTSQETVEPLPELQSVDRVGTYDMACISTVNLVKRFRENYPHLADVVAKMRWGIPVCHCGNHKEDCWYEYGTAYMECWGHFHGETAEHYWAESNSLGGFTRQMNNGRRQDALCDHHGDWNWKKVVKMAAQLLSDLLEASSLCLEKRDIYLRLTVAAGDRAALWARTKHRFVRTGKKEFSSSYRLECTKVPTQKAVHQALLQAELATQGARRSLALDNSSVKATFVNQGLNIAAAQRKCRVAVSSKALAHRPGHDTEIKSRRTRIRNQLLLWRQQQLEFMPEVADKLDRSSLKVEVENEKLWLPSDLTAQERTAMALEDLVAHEIALREGEINDAISDVKSARRQVDVGRRWQKDRARTQTQNTQSLSKVAEAEEKLHDRIAHYNACREALIALGYIDASTAMYPQLRLEDTYRKDADGGRQVGDSRTKDGRGWTVAGFNMGPSASQVRTSVAVSGTSESVIEVGTQSTKRKRQDDARSRAKAPRALKTGDEDSDTSKQKSGWIWQARATDKMSADDMQAWMDEGDRVQWIRAQAEYHRWREQLEKRETEALRVVLKYERMSEVWTSLAAVQPESKPGYAAYARKKAAMWCKMAQDAEVKFDAAGYHRLGEGETIVSRVQERRKQDSLYEAQVLSESRG